MAAQVSPLAEESAEPGRRGPWPGWIYYGLLAPPFVWGLQFILNFALASHACFPAGTTRASFLPGWQGVWTAMLAITVVSGLACLAGLAASGFSWRRLPARRSHPEEQDDILEPRETRIRVFAASAILVSALFAIVLLFNLLSLLWLSTCSQA